jgi:hypothetical protein
MESEVDAVRREYDSLVSLGCQPLDCGPSILPAIPFRGTVRSSREKGTKQIQKLTEKECFAVLQWVQLARVKVNLRHPGLLGP